MATQEQINAARRNGAKSKGPKTAEGKARSSRNALRHGMTARTIVLNYEKTEDFIKLADAYYDKFQPADEFERSLVDEMVVSRWRLLRDWLNETALIEHGVSNQSLNPEPYKPFTIECRYALAFRDLADKSKALHLYIRYEASHQRSFYKALDTLVKLRRQPLPAPELPDTDTDPETVEDTTQPIENEQCETNPTSDEIDVKIDDPSTPVPDPTPIVDDYSPNDRLDRAS